MAGKAEKPSNMLTAARFMDMQTGQNYGLLRSQDEGAPRQRSYSIGTANNDLKLAEKLSVQGGVMLGSLGFKGVATDELTASGILDTSDYNCPRLYITNTTLYDLKVLIPTIKDGQELWIRNNSASAFNITNTSGTGNETTGNIELMAGTTYALGIDDWICFHYDATDSKFKQVTAGKQNIGGGGGSGEVFTWTDNHSAGNFSLTDIDDLDFTIGTANDAHILANQVAGKMQFVLDTTFHWFEWYSGTDLIALLTRERFSLYFNATGVNYDFTDAYADWHGKLLRNTGGISLTVAGAALLGIDFGAGAGNTIKQDSLGNFVYATKSSGDDHKFYAGTEFFRLDGGLNHAICFVPMQIGTLTAAAGSINDAITFLSGSGIFATCTSNFTISAGGSVSQFGASGLGLGGDNLFDAGQVLFAETSPAVTGTDVGFSNTLGSLYCNVQTADSFYFRTAGVARFRIHDEGIEILNTDSTRAWLSIDESTTAPTSSDVASDECKLFCVDDGGGKTILKVQFNTGSPITLATEV